MKKINQTIIADVLQRFVKDGHRDIEYYALSGLSNLRRAYDANLSGSASILLSTFKKINADLDQNVYNEDEEAAVIEGGFILGGFKYSQNSKSVGLQFNSAIKILGETTNLPTESKSDRKKTEEEVNKEREELVAKARTRINNTLSNENATIGELVDALILAQLIADSDLEAKVLKKLEDTIKKQADDAGESGTDQQKIKALQLCQLVGVECQTLQNQVSEIDRKRNLGLCYAEIGKKTLKNFADQTVDKVVCDQ